MICTTALSRVYLGVHYPSDVLAAVAEGIAWLALCFMLQGAWSRHG
jgi:membrane-associated phospholipid phosphatase